MNIALILAGGVGSRMRDDGFPKQYVTVLEKPVLIYTLEKFQACPDVDSIVVVAHHEWEESIFQWAKKWNISKLAGIAPQGDSRQASVRNGLMLCLEHSTNPEDLVLIHDSARPLVTPQLITTCVQSAQGHDGSLPVIGVKDTIYCSYDGRTIHELTDRSTLFCGQSPEAFKLKPYLDLCKDMTSEELLQIRGSSELAFRHGWDICMFPGEENNFKLTTAEDLTRLSKIIEEENK